jgi:hypothetical protein
MSEPRTRSKAWYILPILMGIIGGIIAYFIVKRDDPKLGKNCLKVGIIVFVINLSIGVVIGFFSEMMV